MSEKPDVADQIALAEEELTSCLTRLGQESLDPITQERARDNADEALACVRWLKTAVGAAIAAAEAKGRAEGRAEGYARAREQAAKTLDEERADEAAVMRGVSGRQAEELRRRLKRYEALTRRIRAMQDERAGEGQS